MHNRDKHLHTPELLLPTSSSILHIYQGLFIYIRSPSELTHIYTHTSGVSRACDSLLAGTALLSCCRTLSKVSGSACNSLNPLYESTFENSTAGIHFSNQLFLKFLHQASADAQHFQSSSAGAFAKMPRTQTPRPFTFSLAVNILTAGGSG